jgi:hypothetical protein
MVISTDLRLHRSDNSCKMQHENTIWSSVYIYLGAKSSPMLGGYPCHHGMARPRVADGRDGLSSGTQLHRVS